MARDKNYLINHLDELETEEFEEVYATLSEEDKMEVDDAVSDFADNAVGDPSWRSDW